MKQLLNRARILKGIALGAILTVLLAVPALATTPSTDPVKNAVTPYFSDLAGFATDMIPLVLGVVIIGVAFALGRSWLRRAKG